MSASRPDDTSHPVATELFDENWQARRNRLLNGQSVLQTPNAVSAWQRLALPFGLDMSEEERGHLVESLKSIGEARVALCGVREEFPDEQPAVVLSLESFDPRAFFDQTVLGHIDSALFAESERWVLVCSPEGFSILAGEPVALHAIISRLGGKLLLQSRLDALIDEGEYGDPEVVRPRLLAATAEGGSS